MALSLRELNDSMGKCADALFDKYNEYRLSAEEGRGYTESFTNNELFDSKLLKQNLHEDKVSKILWEQSPIEEKAKLAFLAACLDKMFKQKTFFTVSPMFELEKAGFTLIRKCEGWENLAKFHCVDFSDIPDILLEKFPIWIKQCLNME